MIEPRFRVGDRVTDGKWEHVIVRIDRSFDYEYVTALGGTLSKYRAWELVPPAPLKWTVKCFYNGTRHEHEWLICHGDDELGTLRHEYLARDLCDRQNALADS